MFDAIVGWVVAAAAGALAIWGVRWKLKASRSQKQIDDYRLSSERWKTEARDRVNDIRRTAANQAPVDPKERKDFEEGK